MSEGLWRKLERDLSRIIRGRRTPGSGNRRQKGDAQSKEFLAEAKYRWNYSDDEGFTLGLDLGWIETTWQHAIDSERTPVIALDWGGNRRGILVPRAAVPEIDDGRMATPTDGRAPVIRPEDIGTVFRFTKLRIPDTEWILISWADFSALMQVRSEKKKRKR